MGISTRLTTNDTKKAMSELAANKRIHPAILEELDTLCEPFPKNQETILVSKNSHIPSVSDNTLNQSNVGWGGRVRESDGYIRSRLDIDVEKIVALKSHVSKKEQRRIEIEAQGEVVKDFKVGNVRIKINNAYCRDKTSADVDAILAGIASRSQSQLIAQETAKRNK